MVPNDVRMQINTVDKVHSFSDAVCNAKSTDDCSTNDNTVSSTQMSSSATDTAEVASKEAEPTQSDQEEVDIVINNVVCSFNLRCHLNLRQICTKGTNVEYKRENAMAIMKMRRPYTTASIWSSGRVTCTGATSEAQSKIAARRFARVIGKLGFPVRFTNFRVVNVLGTCSMPWTINIIEFSRHHRRDASYEPELHPGVTYRMRTPKATLKIFSTGSITVTSASVNFVQDAIEQIYPLVYEYRKERLDPNAIADCNVQQDTSVVDDDEDLNNDDFCLDDVAGAGGERQRVHVQLNPKAMSSPSGQISNGQARPKNGATTSNSRKEYKPSNARIKATETWASKQQNNRPYYKGQIYGCLNGLSTSSKRISSERTEKPSKQQKLAPAIEPDDLTDVEESDIPDIALSNFEELIEEEDI